MKRCKYCGAEIEDGESYFMCKDNFMQMKYYEEQDGSDNIYCSQECFCEDLMLAEVYE